MKKYLMTGIAALTLCAGFTSCTSNEDLYDENIINQNEVEQIKQAYKTKFVETFGEVGSNQTWGFGSTTRGTRSALVPSVKNISAPFTTAWVNEYLESAKEPNSDNISDNADNSSYAFDQSVVNYLAWDEGGQEYYNLTNSGKSWEEQLAYALEKHPEWLKKNVDETYVLNFKITTSWDGAIGVVASEGYLPDHVTRSNAERTVVVTGTWNLTEDQRVGQFGKIIVADGGEIIISEGKTLQLVNEAQLAVLSGGTISGAGSVEISNGTAEGQEGYNAGTINVGKFNNNYGDFYNYGTLKTTIMDGGAANSCYYNHGKVYVGHSGSSANMRIYNECQWYVEGDFRFKMLENLSYVYIGGRLNTIGSEDGTGEDAYVALANGALIEAGSLHNTGTKWFGPTTGYAVASFGYIYQLDWAPGNPADGPLANGYFANNIYVNIDNQETTVSGSAGGQLCKNVFWSVVANGQGQGNGGVKEVVKNANGTDVVLPVSEEGFEAGVKGCSPGFKGNTPTAEDPANLRVIAEDLSVGDGDEDFDFNDVVFDVYYGDANTAKVKILAAGGTLPLRVAGTEVHALLGQSTDKMINTNAEAKYPGRGVSGVPAKDILLGFSVNNASEANTKIKVEVEKNGKWIELTAQKGDVAAKMAVGTDYNWCDERTYIGDVYSGFKNYVNNGTDDDWNKWYK